MRHSIWQTCTQGNPNWEITGIHATLHALILQFKENWYSTRPCAPCDVVKEITARFGQHPDSFRCRKACLENRPEKISGHRSCHRMQCPYCINHRSIGCSNFCCLHVWQRLTKHLFAAFVSRQTTKPRNLQPYHLISALRSSTGAKPASQISQYVANGVLLILTAIINHQFKVHRRLHSVLWTPTICTPYSTTKPPAEHICR